MAHHFHEPATVEEAVRIKRELFDSARFMAGGTEVNNRRAGDAPSHVIWLGRLGLGEILRREGGVSIGATATLQEILESGIVHPAIREAARNHANRNIRNVATIGGHLGVCRSCADLVPVLLSLRARLRVAGDMGETERSCESWVFGERDGLVLSVEVPDPPQGSGVALDHYSRTANDLSIVTAAVSMRVEEGRARDVILAVGGVAATAIRLAHVEAALEGNALLPKGAIEALVAAHVAPIDDIRGSAAFKRVIAGTLVERASLVAWSRAQEGR